MREANLKTRQVQAKEELELAQIKLDECRQKLAYAREQVSQVTHFVCSDNEAHFFL